MFRIKLLIVKEKSGEISHTHPVAWWLELTLKNKGSVLVPGLVPSDP